MQAALEAYVQKVACDAIFKAQQAGRCRVSAEHWFSAQARGHPDFEMNVVTELRGRQRETDSPAWRQVLRHIDKPGLLRLFCCGGIRPLSADVILAARRMIFDCCETVLLRVLKHAEYYKRSRISLEHLKEAIGAPIPEGLGIKVAGSFFTKKQVRKPCFGRRLSSGEKGGRQFKDLRSNRPRQFKDLRSNPNEAEKKAHHPIRSHASDPTQTWANVVERARS